ncbi:MAG: trypsin-like peptidase domain-containing protein [Rickettsiales bacterium]|nr:trypsin-like peptidase domain-containing protein [Rickettsiales bacterium]
MKENKTIFKVFLKGNIYYLYFLFFLLTANANDLQKNIQKVLPNVVKVNTNTNSGTGVIISEDGYILTAAHIVNMAQQKIKITFNNNKNYIANIVGVDELLDIALLKIEKDEKFNHIDLKNKFANIGEFVFVIGNPLNIGLSVKYGIVSAVNVNLNISNLDDFIQLDVQTNKGNSGSPIFNMDGEIIGLVNLKYGDNGISFAISTNSLQSIVEELKKYGEIRHGYLGITTEKIDKDTLKTLGVRESGVIITNIVQNGPVKDADLMVSDIILSYNDEKITESSQLNSLIDKTEVDADVEMEIFRNNKKLSVVVTIGENNKVEKQNDLLTKSIDVLDAYLLPIDNVIRDDFNLPNANGLYVLGVKQDGIAEKYGLMEGDVIIYLEQKPITKNLLLNAIKQQKHKIILIVNRNNENKVIVLNLD